MIFGPLIEIPTLAGKSSAAYITPFLRARGVFPFKVGHLAPLSESAKQAAYFGYKDQDQLYWAPTPRCFGLVFRLFIELLELRIVG